MTDVYPKIAPYESGMLDVGDGNSIYWEVCGNPDGKPAVRFHGGPGSGCAESFRRLFDPGAYRIVLFDQRNCGRSTPHAGDPTTDLAANTTWHLVADIETLRVHLGIDRWLVVGGSWGSTLALTYAEAHPARVSELILFGVTTGRHLEFDWTFRGGLSLFFPEQWERLCRAGGCPRDDGHAVIETYHRQLNDPDRAVRERAAEAWCLWESATPAWPPTTGLEPRFRDPRYAVAFARIVTHYVRHNAWLEDEVLLRNASCLADMQGVLINGRFDFQAPIENSWRLREVWPGAELVVVDNAGHGAPASINREIVHATQRFAARHAAARAQRRTRGGQPGRRR
jgi:proline iminopeptidase